MRPELPGSAEAKAVQLMSKVAVKLHEANGTCPWQCPRSTAETVQFTQKLFEAPKGFCPIVLARDIGVLFGEDTFRDDACCDMGDGALEGLDDVLPKVGGKNSPP